MSPELIEAMKALEDASDRLRQLRGQNTTQEECEAAQQAFEAAAEPVKKLMAEHSFEQLRKRLTERGKKLL